MLILAQTQEMAKCHATNNYKPPRTFGVHCQLPEVSSNAFNYNRISGVSSRLKNFDFISSKGEDKKAKKACQSILDNPLPSVQQLSQLLGYLTSTIRAVFPATTHFRYLQMDKNEALSTCQDYSATLRLSQHAKEELIWWRDNLEAWNGRP